MARSDRLIQLTQVLRRHRHPVTAAVLAAETAVSERTIYRDIASLQASGVPVRGEAGIGYVLESGFDLPPLMFTAEEIEALMLGARFVRERGDPALKRAIDDAVAKIEAVLPENLRLALNEASFFAPLFGKIAPDSVSSDDLRRALRENRKVRIRYRDLAERETERVVWPVLIGYFQYARGLVGFCELRNDFRHFRTDRMISLDVLDAHPPRRRAVLMREWERSAEREALLCQREPPRLPRPGDPALRPAAE
ncbi:helix-turn-helix transcriptional regulator [Rhabdaerophilum calidifontis]|uniref:helix-turn-helix transcriptional regulator n=1 Tax=Rhabdaerophilum calidifontis TaxID=2604328 RepID=UPI0012395466|nr:YafY family protein [Rhabdaerophilum calidifontis]